MCENRKELIKEGVNMPVYRLKKDDSEKVYQVIKLFFHRKSKVELVETFLSGEKITY